MSERLSNYSRVVLARMLEAAICTGCGEQNLPGRKAMVELTDDAQHAYCNRCGVTFPVERPRVEPVG